jgi:hypothetical protein
MPALPPRTAMPTLPRTGGTSVYSVLEKRDPAWLATLSPEAQKMLKYTQYRFGGLGLGIGSYNRFTGNVRVKDDNDLETLKHEAMHAVAAKLPYPTPRMESPRGTHTVERAYSRYGSGIENWDEPLPNRGVSFREGLPIAFKNNPASTILALARGVPLALFGQGMYALQSRTGQRGGEQFVNPLQNDAIGFDPSRLPVEMQKHYAPFFTPDAMRQKIGTLADMERESRGVPPIMVRATNKMLLKPAATINTIRARRGGR